VNLSFESDLNMTLRSKNKGYIDSAEQDAAMNAYKEWRASTMQRNVHK
jgi:hypothetical protein